MLTVSTSGATLTAINNLAKTQRTLGTTFNHLSTGKRVASAADDAAGLGVAEKLRSRSASAQQAIRNTNDGTSIAQTAEGSMDQVMDILVRLRELSVQAGSGTLATEERAYIQDEADQLVEEIDRIASVTEYNGLYLTNGNASTSTISVQVGIEETSPNQITMTFGDLRTTVSGLGLASVHRLDSTYTTGATMLSAATSALSVLNMIDSAIGTVNSYRSDLGAVQNRLDYTLGMLEGYDENLQNAESTIRDADYALETAKMTKDQVLTQAGVAVLSQAKSISQNVLGLLQ